MTNIRFEWDEAKNLSNQRKHGISFEEAVQVFKDPLHLSRQDRIESGEHRWQTMGQIYSAVVLIVAHTFVEEDSNGEPVEVVRVISARRATRVERKRYEHEQNTDV